MEDEIEAVLALYGSDATFEGGNLHVICRPAGDASTSFVEVGLLFHIPPNYPDLNPSVCVDQVCGLADDGKELICNINLYLQESASVDAIILATLNMVTAYLESHNNAECSICLEPLQSSDHLVSGLKTQCKHLFHLRCLCQWAVECFITEDSHIIKKRDSDEAKRNKAMHGDNTTNKNQIQKNETALRMLHSNIDDIKKKLLDLDTSPPVPPPASSSSSDSRSYLNSKLFDLQATCAEVTKRLQKLYVIRDETETNILKAEASHLLAPPSSASSEVLSASGLLLVKRQFRCPCCRVLLSDCLSSRRDIYEKTLREMLCRAEQIRQGDGDVGVCEDPKGNVGELDDEQQRWVREVQARHRRLKSSLVNAVELRKEECKLDADASQPNLRLHMREGPVSGVGVCSKAEEATDLTHSSYRAREEKGEFCDDLWSIVQVANTRRRRPATSTCKPVSAAGNDQRSVKNILQDNSLLTKSVQSSSKAQQVFLNQSPQQVDYPPADTAPAKSKKKSVNANAPQLSSRSPPPPLPLPPPPTSIAPPGQPSLPKIDRHFSKECLICGHVFNSSGDVCLRVIGVCEHSIICSNCALASRWKHANKHCAMCRELLPVMICFESAGDDCGMLANTTFKKYLKSIRGSEDFVLDSHSALYVPRCHAENVLSPLSYTCQDCGELSTPDVEVFKQHILDRHDKRPCHLCLKNRTDFPSHTPIYSTDALTSHLHATTMLSHSSGVLHKQCFVCKDVFFDESDLLAHQDKEHLTCALCVLAGNTSNSSHVFRSISMLNKHYRSSHVQSMCKRCDSSGAIVVFPTSDELAQHCTEVHGVIGVGRVSKK